MKIVTLMIREGEVKVIGFNGRGCAAIQEAFAKAMAKAMADPPVSSALPVRDDSTNG